MRLTKDIKAAILDAALTKSGVPALETAIRKRYAVWIESVRVRAITPEVEQVQEKIKELKAGLPKGLFDSNLRTGSDMFVNVAGQRRRFWWCGAQYRDGATKTNEKRICLYEQTLTADDPLVQQIYDIDADSVTVRERRESVTAAVNAHLNAATTVKALLKLWPECEPLIPTEVVPSGVNLPSVPVADLNKLVNLP